MYWWVRKICQKLKKRKGFPLIRQNISLLFKGSGILTNAKTNNTFFHKAHALEFTESNERITIDRMHKWRPKIYSFVYLLMRLTSLALKRHFCYILFMKTRLVRLISTQTKEYFFGRYLCIRSIGKRKWTFFTDTATILNFIGTNSYYGILDGQIRTNLPPWESHNSALKRRNSKWSSNR